MRKEPYVASERRRDPVLLRRRVGGVTTVGVDAEEACRASLARMGREKLELVQAHWSAQRFQPWQGALRGLDPRALPTRPPLLQACTHSQDPMPEHRPVSPSYKSILGLII